MLPYYDFDYFGSGTKLIVEYRQNHFSLSFLLFLGKIDFNLNKAEIDDFE